MPSPDQENAAPGPWRGIFADTTALVTFFTCTGIINERFIAGMDWGQVLDARLIGAPLMVLTARPYGVWRDSIMAKAVNPTGLRGLVADAFALLVFQVPIYMVILALAGAGAGELARAAAGVSIMMLVLGRPYGLWLTFVRDGMGATGQGQKPMSLGG